MFTKHTIWFCTHCVCHFSCELISQIFASKKEIKQAFLFCYLHIYIQCQKNLQLWNINFSRTTMCYIETWIALNERCRDVDICRWIVCSNSKCQNDGTQPTYWGQMWQESIHILWQNKPQANILSICLVLL